MGKRIKLKMIACTAVLVACIMIIFLQMSNSASMKVKEKQTQAESTKVEIETSSFENSDVKLYQKTEEEAEFTEIEQKEEKDSLFKKTNTFELETKDESAPDNVSNIKSVVAEDYIIISFAPAKDNATLYEYYIEGMNENETTKTDTVKISSDSGIKGYNYIIDNQKETKAGTTINKTDDEPILISDINWSNDYYIHIRAIDNSGNCSDNTTYKINLPSNGVKLQYLDANSNNIISPEETIIGSVNEEYNANEYNKILEGYKLVNVEGETSGKLKKERINIKYKYAKLASIEIKYIDKITGEEIANKTTIEGYEGKEFEINAKNINGYKYETGEVSGTMKAGNQEITLYYNKLGNIITSYIDENSGEKIIPDFCQTYTYNQEFKTNSKEIPGYQLSKVEGREEGTITNKEEKIIYYYKKIVQVDIKHVDINTKEVIENETIEALEGDKIKIHAKEFDGYIQTTQNEKNTAIEVNEENASTKTSDQSNVSTKDNNENTLKEDDEKYTNNIIDEILGDEYESPEIEEDANEKNENGEKIKDKNIKKEITNNNINANIKQEYDIVVDSKETEYIIYYKKK